MFPEHGTVEDTAVWARTQDCTMFMEAEEVSAVGTIPSIARPAWISSSVTACALASS